MFNKILVPLDGSELAEGILPYVSSLAKGLGIPVVLLSVIDHDAMEVPERVRPESRAAEEAARARLVAVVERLGKEGVNAEYRLTSGKPAERIAEVAESEGCDLVAMSTHGRSAIGRGIMGSVTDKLVHIGHLPILTMTPDRARDYWKEGVEISRVMVPLDGSPVSESVLPYVEELAARLSLEVVLVRVAKLASMIFSEALPQSGGANLDAEIETEATEYLKGVARRLSDNGLNVQWKLLSGSPAVAIVDLARETPHDLIAMATHGRSGVTRWVVGSVAEAVVRASGDPVLIIPPK
jgi:nucleotide-binding universal stress UspA family protein